MLRAYVVHNLLRGLLKDLNKGIHRQNGPEFRLFELVTAAVLLVSFCAQTVSKRYNTRQDMYISRFSRLKYSLPLNCASSNIFVRWGRKFNVRFEEQASGVVHVAAPMEHIVLQC